MRNTIRPGIFFLSAIVLPLLLTACHIDTVGHRSQAIGDIPLPTPKDPKAVIHHHAFTLEYSEADEQARWVAYMICQSRLDGPYKRQSTPGCRFHEDNKVRSQSATDNDYRNSGYSRGHLAPAADMKWDSLALVESFLLSNASPQNFEFNSGVWNRLEMLVRQWAKTYDTIYVVTGPLLSDNGKGHIGMSQVTIPTAFFKAVYIPSAKKAIGFLVPHEQSKAPLRSFVMSIDALEAAIDIDLFPGIADETELEASADLSGIKIK